MALTSILAQSRPAAATLDNIYTVPASFRDAIYVVATNTTATADTCRIAFVPSGESLTQKHYVAHDISVSTKPQATRRVALPPGAGVWVYSTAGSLNFCVNGIEQDV